MLDAYDRRRVGKALDRRLGRAHGHIAPYGDVLAAYRCVGQIENGARLVCLDGILIDESIHAYLCSPSGSGEFAVTEMGMTGAD
jgi:hypothetical protein